MSVQRMKTGLAAVSIVAAVALTGADAGSDVPMTSFGKPSLQGTWDFRTATPMQRPERWKDQEYLSEEEVAEIEQAILDGRESARESEGDLRGGGGQSDVDVGYNSGFLELSSTWTKSRRTSLIVDPPNGRMPARLPESREREAPYVAMQGLSPAGPEQRSLTDRCILGFNASPMTSGAYNNIMQIVQSESHVAIQVEMVNDHRVIPTNGGAPIDANMRFYKGHSTGQWDGDTFVVTTSNYKEHAEPQGTGPMVVLTERFKRLDYDTLEYEWTINDPETFEAPYTVRQEFNRTDDDVYEYACHEGNYSMPLVLRAARKLELEGKTDDDWMPSWHKR